MNVGLPPGALLHNGKYKVLKVLGQGGFGITYLATHLSLGRKVAIKEFYMNGFCERNGESRVFVPSVGSNDMVARYKDKFLSEARKIATLSHRNIVTIFDVFEENDTAYYVMRYYSGSSLADKVACGALDEVKALGYIRQIASALEYIHDKHMMHLDVKPANILLDEDDNAVLIDFGLAKHYDVVGAQTTTTLVGVSPGYAPREQYRIGGVGRFSPATDIYSLGATFYKLLSGTTPPEANDIDECGLPSLPARVSLNVRNAVYAAMRFSSKDRPQRISEFLDIIDRGLCGNDDNSRTILNDMTGKSCNDEMLFRKKIRLGVLLKSVSVLIVIGVLFFIYDKNNSDGKPVEMFVETAEEMDIVSSVCDTIPEKATHETDMDVLNVSTIGELSDLNTVDIAMSQSNFGDVEYFVEESEEYSFFDRKLYAKVGGYQYEVELEDTECFDIHLKDDFDGDGVMDLLMVDILACGGNASGNSYFFVTYKGDGYFSVSNKMGENVWGEPEIEEWRGKKTILLLDDIGNHRTMKKRYIYENGDAKLVESYEKKRLTAVDEVHSSQFHGKELGHVISLYHDLDGNGQQDVIECTYWDRWDLLIFDVTINNGEYFYHDGGYYRVGVDANKTNGVHNLICGDDDIYVWNGSTYELLK